MAYLGSAFVRRGGIFQDALADKSGETGHELSMEFCCCTCTFANILCGFVLTRGKSKYVGYQLDRKGGWSGRRLELKMLTPVVSFFPSVATDQDWFVPVFYIPALFNC